MAAALGQAAVAVCLQRLDEALVAAGGLWLLYVQASSTLGQ